MLPQCLHANIQVLSTHLCSRLQGALVAVSLCVPCLIADYPVLPPSLHITIKLLSGTIDVQQHVGPVSHEYALVSPCRSLVLCGQGVASSGKEGCSSSGMPGVHDHLLRPDCAESAADERGRLPLPHGLVGSGHGLQRCCKLHCLQGESLPTACWDMLCLTLEDSSMLYLAPKSFMKPPQASQ